MKNVFKKTVALVSAMSLMAVGTAVSVSATAEKPELELEANTLTPTSATDYNTYEVKPGETVSVQVAIKNSVGAKFDTIQFQHKLGSLTMKKLPREVNAEADSEKVQMNQSYAKEQEVDEEDYVIATYTVVVPSEGGEYTMEWSDPSSYQFNLINTHVDKTKNLDYTTKGIKFIVAGAVDTTVTTVTTPEPTTTTTEAITTVATTTTTAPATTVATTTTTAPATTTVVTSTEAAATTTVTTTAKPDVSKKDNSPATGSSSNGVAALAVTMVAAAGAAIALKKKKD